MDADAVEAAGLGPIDDELDAVADAPDRSSLATVIGRHQRVGVGGAISHYVDTDAKNSERYLIHFSQSGISLPDESYYREDNYAEIREKYVAHIDKMFTPRRRRLRRPACVRAREEDRGRALGRRQAS